MHRKREIEERPPLPGAGYMEDYTVPFLWMAGLLTFIALFALWAAWGLPVALACAWVANHLIGR